MFLPKPLNIFVLDDNPDVVDVVEAYLEEDKRFNICTFTEPKKAAEAIAKARFGILLLDINMPEMNGDEFMRKIAPMETGVRTIIMSGENSLMNLATVFRLGAYDFVLKPFNEKDLKEAIEKCINYLTTWEAKVVDIVSAKKK